MKCSYDSWVTDTLGTSPPIFSSLKITHLPTYTRAGSGSPAHVILLPGKHWLPHVWTSGPSCAGTFLAQTLVRSFLLWVRISPNFLHLQLQRDPSDWLSTWARTREGEENLSSEKGTTEEGEEQECPGASGGFSVFWAVAFHTETLSRLLQHV